MLKSSGSKSSQPNVGRSFLVVAVWVFVAFLMASSTSAETLYVSPIGKDSVKFGGTNFPNPCAIQIAPCKTIKHAVALAQDGDLVSVAGGTYVETITVSKSITIEGAGALSFGAGAQNTWVDGNKQDRVFTIWPGVSVHIRHMLIRNGKGSGIHNGGNLTVKGVIVALNEGTGIYSEKWVNLDRVWIYKNNGPGLVNHGSSSATYDLNVQLNLDGIVNSGNPFFVKHSAILNNQKRGVANYGKLNMANVTISGNGNGGLHIPEGEAQLRFVTITANAAFGAGVSGIDAMDAVKGEISNSIVYGNGKGSAQCAIKNWTVGHNVVADSSCGFPSSNNIVADPKLKALSYNGGFTQTHALSPGSPAIDLVPQDQCVPADQRGVPRPIDGNGDGKLGCDAGAYEFKP